VSKLTRRPPVPAPEDIAHSIVALRGHKILLDTELARLYGVPTKRLNEQVRRNRERFPEDFMFQVNAEEFEALRSQFATSNAAPGRGGRRYRPYAFTEHGALMAANVLNSARAIEVSVYVVRAFMRLRETLAAHKDLAKTLQQLEKKTEALTLQHDTLAANTRAQFKQVFGALRALMTPAEPKKRPIGFVTSKEK
jgi:phage regulator Rha-like protein